MQRMETRWFELSGGELRVLGVAAGIVLLSLVVLEALRVARREPEIRVDHVREALRTPPRLDLNAIKEHELRLLPGIGEKTARAILEERQARGGFARLEELTDVPGIGPKLLERLRPHLMCVPADKGEQ